MIEVKLPSGRIVEALERSDFSAHRALMAGADYARRDAIHDRRVDALEFVITDVDNIWRCDLNVMHKLELTGPRKTDAVPMTRREIEGRLIEAMQLRVTEHITEKHRARQRGRVNIPFLMSCALAVITGSAGFMAWHRHLNRFDAAPHVAPPAASRELIPPPLPFYTTITIDTGKYRRVYQIHNPGGQVTLYSGNPWFHSPSITVDLDSGDVK